MRKTLAQWLEEIGQEIWKYIRTEDGQAYSLIKDEALAREIWRRALGYEEESVGPNGEVVFRSMPPDPKAQRFIFERREGQFPTASETKQSPIAGQIDRLLTDEVNKIAQDADIRDSISEDS